LYLDIFIFYSIYVCILKYLIRLFGKNDGDFLCCQIQLFSLINVVQTIYFNMKEKKCEKIKYVAKLIIEKI